MNIVSGLRYEDSETTARIYFWFPGLRICDILMYLCCVGAAVLGLFARQQLAEFKKWGPKMYMIFWGVELAWQLLYLIAVSIITGMIVADAKTASQLCISLFMGIFNYLYFKKRRHMFIY